MTNPNNPETRIELSTINVTALRMTVETLLGDYGVFEKAYRAIDNAMAYGLNAGAEEAKRSIQEADDAGKRGVEAAAKLSEVRYREGYCDGVNDARRRPKEADLYVRNIIEAADPELVNAVAAMGDECVIPRDSGDETTYDALMEGDAD
jgi:hypothetical protein